MHAHVVTGQLLAQPDAWKTTSDNGRGFPAQLPFEELFNFLPVPEKRIKHLFDSNIRITGLSAWQVMELIKIYGDYEAEIATTAASKIVQHFGNTCANAGVDVSQGAAVAASPAPQSGGQGGGGGQGGNNQARRGGGNQGRGGGGGGGGGQQQQQQQDGGGAGGKKRGGRGRKTGGGKPE